MNFVPTAISSARPLASKTVGVPHEGISSAREVRQTCLPVLRS
jgi:hypothetical protein